VSSSRKGFKGPAICLGAYRALAVGMQGGHLITAHVSRCVLHRRSPHSLAAGPVLPDRRDWSLENALNTDLLFSFSMDAAVAEHFNGLKVQRPCDAAEEYEATQIWPDETIPGQFDAVDECETTQVLPDETVRTFVEPLTSGASGNLSGHMSASPIASSIASERQLIELSSDGLSMGLKRHTADSEKHRPVECIDPEVPRSEARDFGKTLEPLDALSDRMLMAKPKLAKLLRMGCHY
jgi:hypothetical protein